MPERPGLDVGGLPGQARRGRYALIALVVAVLIAGLVAFSLRRDDAGGSLIGGAAETTTSTPAEPTTTADPTGQTSPDGIAGTSVPEPASPATSTPGPTATGPGPARLVLGGKDLGVTRVGAPMREAVAAVSAALGRPVADPASDSACIGAEAETSWEGFRLANSGGKVSGWRSTSRTLATPAGATVGTRLDALRKAYGTAFQIRPAAEPGDLPVFVITGADLAGTLTGSGPADTVSAIYNGTCQSE